MVARFARDEPRLGYIGNGIDCCSSHAPRRLPMAEKDLDPTSDEPMDAPDEEKIIAADDDDDDFEDADADDDAEDEDEAETE